MIPKLKSKGTKLQPVPIQPMMVPQKMAGFQSYPEPSSLPPEMFSMLRDARLSKGVIVARDGNGATTNAIASGTARGIYECIQNGTPTIFCAVGDGTHCSIYRSTNEGGAWTNISPTSGPYGDTRLTDSASTQVFFLLVSDNAYGQPTNTDVLLIQNGVDAPRVYAYTPGTTSYVMSKQFPAIEQVPNNNFLTSQPGFLKSFPLNLPASQYYMNTGATPPFLLYAPGSGAAAHVTLNASGGIATFVVDAGGAGYTGHVVCYLQGGGGNGGGIISITTGAGAVTAGSIVAPGQYDAVPSVFFVQSTLQLTIPAGCTQNGTATVRFTNIAQFTASISGTVMTVTGVVGGTGAIAVGNHVYGAGVTAGTTIVSLGTGVGGVGTYNLSVSQTVGSESMTAGNGLDMSQGSQLAMIVDQITPYDHNLIYSNLKVSIGDIGGTFATCYDPGSSIGSAIVLNYPLVATSNASNSAQAGSGNASQVAYSMPPTPGTIDLTNIVYVRFTYLPPVAIPTDMAIYMMSNSGDVQGGGRFGVGYYQDDSRTIGPGQIITNLPSATPGYASGGTNAPGITILEDPRFFYDYLLTAPVPNSTNVAAGVDYILVFREDIGQTYFYYCAKAPCASYSGSWTAATNPVLIQRPSEDPGAAVDFAQPLPYATALTVPIGTAMDSLNGRVLIAAGSTLYISDYEQPFTYTLAQRFLSPGNPDSLSGTSQTRSGETFKQIVSLGAIAATAGTASSPLTGTGTVYVWTDSNYYQIPGFSPTGLNSLSFIGTHGTLSPYSVAKLRTAVFWLDQQMEICQFSPGMSAIYGVSVPDMQIHVLSLYRVDDQTQGIPQARQVWACGAVRNNRYYLSYTPNGGTKNTACLVWSDQQGLFESIDSFGIAGTSSMTDAQFLLPYLSTQGYVRMLYVGTFSGNAEISEQEIPGSTFTVGLYIGFRELNSGYTKLIEMDTVQVAAIAVSPFGAFSLTSSRVFDGASGSPVTGTLSWASGEQSTKVDAAPVGGSGNRVLLTLYGNVPGGTALPMVSACTSTLEVSYRQS